MTLVRAERLTLPDRLQPTELLLEEGTLTCLVGPNGSGKTSLLHALARIGRAQGEVRIGGQDPEALPPQARTKLLTYLPATRDLAWPMAARSLVSLSGAGAEAVEAILARLELGAVASRRADRLSTGERSRVLIARAMASAPRLLLLDEPTANLDPLWQIRLMDILRADIRSTARAALVAMHDLDAAARYADRLVVMDGGRIAANGEPASILGSDVIPHVFGIERGPKGWNPAPIPSAGP